MFITYEDDEITFGQIFHTEGEKTWSCVERHHHIPWFHVSYDIRDTEYDGWVTHISFLSNLKQLLSFKSQETEDIKIKYVDLVTPGHMNGTGRWNMEPLIEIFQGYEPEPGIYKSYLADTLGLEYDAKQVAYIYVVENGSRYVDSGLDTPEKKLVNIEQIFKL